jgi:hypothetical protein
MSKGILYSISMLLLIIGGINWGLVGLGGIIGGSWNLVDMIFGANSMLANVVYLLVGLSGLYAIYAMTQKN